MHDVAYHRKVEPELFPCLRKYGISFYEFNPREYHRAMYSLPIGGSQPRHSRWRLLHREVQLSRPRGGTRLPVRPYEGPRKGKSLACPDSSPHHVPPQQGYRARYVQSHLISPPHTKSASSPTPTATGTSRTSRRSQPSSKSPRRTT